MFATRASRSDPLPDIQTLLSPAQPHLEALNAYLEREIEAFEPEARKLVAYCLRHTGKQIRPMLLFFSGWQSESPSPQPDLVRAAAVVELVHQATLVHDDILDGATLRHNTPTLSKAYDAQTAVLLGDILFSHALKLASDFPTVAVCQAVSQATRRVCIGEIAQNFYHRNPDISLEDYYRVIDLKTAELFRVSCELGAQLSGYSEAYVEAAGHFGRHLGIAYQIFDDMADLTGNENRIGKTLGTDVGNGKFTLPILLLLNALEKDERNDLLKHIQASMVDRAALAEQLRKHSIRDHVEEAFLDQLAQAENALAPYTTLPPTPLLLNLSAYVRNLLSHTQG